MKDLYQTADWKKEKHVPVITISDQVKKDVPVDVKVEIGKEIAHPNTSEHYIGWIELLFLPEGEKFPYMVGHVSFEAHGASTEGPNTSTVYSEPSTSFLLKTGKPGKLLANSYCNIHGLWTSEKDIKVA